ncbi:hypothetical protein NB640_06795 [Oxalobacter vibrioformis]|uniref:Uncharacterized protein n=1 Tax=Oxalobacter vibrioformis TaxID=933080 RepID=A0A9E9P1N3_9BURK|nr:hypothetical protein [Oxalobacter vibrioformis]WAW08999.1 hypothetical protein NB640_06795 [Oxalobacter vibrioformis]
MNSIKVLFSTLSIAALIPVMEESAQPQSLALQEYFEAYTHPAYPPVMPFQHGYGRRIEVLASRRKGRSEMSAPFPAR